MYSGTCLMWSPMGPHVQLNLSNVVICGTSCTVEPVQCGHLQNLMYSGTCLMWSPIGPYFLAIGWIKQVLLFGCDNVSSLLLQLPVYTYFKV